MGILVEEVASPQGLRQFIRYPLELYAGDPYFVPYLLAERREFFSPRNPLFEFIEVAYFLARDSSGRLLGRVTAHINRLHNEHWNERTGFFGFYESINDSQVASALMEAVEGWVRQRGMDRVRGPFNFSTNEECGFLAEGFDRMPTFMMPYTKPYYLDLMADVGYQPVKNLVAYYYEYQGAIPERLRRFAEHASSLSGVVIRTIRMNDFEAEVKRAMEIYNRAWAQNWGFVPVTEAQFAHMARQLKPIVDPELGLIAEMNGEPIGFSLALPDYNPVLKKMNGRLFPFGLFIFLWYRRKLNRIRVLTMGVVPEHRKRGVDVLLIYHTFVNGLRRGYTKGEFSWVLEDNVMLRRLLDRMGALPYKTYRIFEKQL